MQIEGNTDFFRTLSVINLFILSDQPGTAVVADTAEAQMPQTIKLLFVGAGLMSFSSYLEAAAETPVNYDSAPTYTVGTYDDSATFSDSSDFSYDDEGEDDD